MHLPTNFPVVVTGASGFIALHLVKLLLDGGHQVRGTIRNPARAESLRESLTTAGSNVDGMEFVTANLMSDDGWDDILQGTEYAFHVASPIPQEPPRNDSELVDPAQGGTLRVLRAASRHGVRRVVVTSSISAILQGHPRDGSKIFTEADWSIAGDGCPAYDKSKTVAEQSAWKFVAALPADARLELATINPGFVLGPSLDADHGTSNELVRKLVNRALPGLPDLHFALVHVRDVAELHFRAMLEPRAAGLRFCCALQNMHVAEIAQVLAQAGYRVPQRHIPNWAVALSGLFDRQVAVILPELGKRSDFDCALAREVLQWKPRTAESAILEAAMSLERVGLTKYWANPERAKSPA